MITSGLEAFNIEGNNGKYKVVPVDSYDENGEVDEDVLCKADVVIDEDDEVIFVMEHNGSMKMAHSSLRLLLEFVGGDFEKKVIDAIKSKGYFHEVNDNDVMDVRLYVIDLRTRQHDVIPGAVFLKDNPFYWARMTEKQEDDWL